MPADLPRRRLLGGGLLAVAALAAGCRSSAGAAAPTTSPSPSASGPSPVATSPQTVDVARLEAIELTVMAAYAKAIARSHGRNRSYLRQLRRQHVAHLLALGGPAGNRPIALRGSLSDLEVATARQFRAAADRADDGATAALLASIAASHAGHDVLLRQLGQGR